MWIGLNRLRGATGEGESGDESERAHGDYCETVPAAIAVAFSEAVIVGHCEQ